MAKKKKGYYEIKTMDTPSRAMYGLAKKDKVLLIGTARPQDWAISIDVDPDSPCDVLGDGLTLPFPDDSFDVVVLDYVTNFLPKEKMVRKMISEANRVGLKVVGRATITPSRKTLKGPKQRFTHTAYPDGVEWLE